MTDVVAVVACLIANCRGDAETAIQTVLNHAGTQFSPMVTAFLSDEALRRDLAGMLTADDAPFMRELFEKDNAE